MLKDRLNAADMVAVDFLKAETAADEAALMASSCVATMLKARAEARLPVGTGARALQLVSDAAADLLRARQRLIDAHSALVDVRDEIGLRNHYASGYGDEGKCPPELMPAGRVEAPERGVRLVAAA